MAAAAPVAVAVAVAVASLSDLRLGASYRRITAQAMGYSSSFQCGRLNRRANLAFREGPPSEGGARGGTGGPMGGANDPARSSERSHRTRVVVMSVIWSRWTNR